MKTIIRIIAFTTAIAALAYFSSIANAAISGLILALMYQHGTAISLRRRLAMIERETPLAELFGSMDDARTLIAVKRDLAYACSGLRVEVNELTRANRILEMDAQRARAKAESERLVNEALAQEVARRNLDAHATQGAPHGTMLP